jgi:multiple sugar transport system substrate-binding protein
LKQAGDAGLQDLAIPGAREYEEALDRAISAAYAGTDPKTALDGAAQEWNAITDRIGKDAQQTAYNGWVERGGKNAYP